MTIIKPVIVQTIIVSIKVCVIETRACETGSFVFAAAAAIGELPRPDSLENIPRETPFCMVLLSKAPNVPPMAA